MDLSRLQRLRSPNVHPRRVNQQAVLPCHEHWPLSGPACGRGWRSAANSFYVSAFAASALAAKVFWISRHCDRGQRYCSPLCRQRAYRQQRRLANCRHQQSTEGRLDHRDRQREYRRRRTNARVTDQGSLRSSFHCRILLQAKTPTLVRRQSRPRAFSGWLRCVVCGRRGRFIDPYS
jgi:hypothetical protein